MASGNSDTILWFGLFIFGFYATRAVHMQLQAVRTASEITKEEKAPELITQQTEDALKLHTLRQLADGANYEIRMAATKIIIERASHGEAYKILLQDLSGKNSVKRDKALTALKFLYKSPVHDRICNHATYKALVDCLCRFLDNESAHPVTRQDTNYTFRPQAEKTAMQLLYQLCRYKLGEAYRAGFVSRWLARYPFGGLHSSESQKREIVQRLKIPGGTEDDDMSTILHFLDSDPEGRKQLRNHGLVGSAIGESPDDDDDDGDNPRISWNSLGIDGEPGARYVLDHVTVLGDGSSREVFGRTREESEEEHALRRRRREAMVLSEGGGPISSDNIIQREDPIPG